jgi:hypothetical protein
VAAKEIIVKKYVVKLSQEERGQLDEFIRKGKRPAQLLTRAQAKLIALTCGRAPVGHAKWSLRLLEQKVVERNCISSKAPATTRSGGLSTKHSPAASSRGHTVAAQSGSAPATRPL